MVQSESENRLMSWNIVTQAFRDTCGSNVSEAVGTKSRDVVPDTSRDREPVKGLQDGSNEVSLFGLQDETCRRVLNFEREGYKHNTVRHTI